MDSTALRGSSSLNRYTLDIIDSPVRADVLRFRGVEALSRSFLWQIEFTTALANIVPEQVLMKYASFAMRDSKIVYGIITGLQRLATTADQSHYRLTLESRLALLSRSRRCALYQNLSVTEVVEQLLRLHGMEGSDFEFRLSRHYPARELVTQWRETDLEFIQRILSETGIWFRQEINNITGLDVTVFCDSQLHYVFKGALPYHQPSGQQDGAELCCWGARCWHHAVAGRVSSGDYNPGAADKSMDASIAVRSPAVTTGEQYRYAESCREAGDDTVAQPESESGAFYARLHHERLLNTSARVHLFSNAFWLSPGMVIEPLGIHLQDLNEGVIITFTSFIGARDSRLHVSVWGMPYREEYCFRPAEIARPVVFGTLPGRVESRNPHDLYAHLDKHGRYRVRMDFNQDDCEPGYASPWLRLIKPAAGDRHGWHMPLIDGTEVGVGFHNGDPDRPYIANTFHDSAHRDIVNHDNHSQNILRTAAHNELRMEDKRGEEHTHLSTEYGKSQLSQGYMADAAGKLRGTGFELRTDQYGVIRVAKGLFISADGQQKAAGEVLDMDSALREIDLCLQQMQQLQLAAEQAQALKADIDDQRRMFNQRLKLLNKVLHFSAPEGMAFTSGEHLQLAASENIAINAGDDISVGAMGNMAALAGEQLGLFARSGQLSLISGQGPVELQAQNGNMRLFAEKKLTLSSAEVISLTGKKGITLIGGGSYLKLEGGKIEYGTAGTCLRQAKRTITAAPQAMPMKMPYLPGTGKYDLALNFTDGLNAPVAKAPYVIRFDGGSELTGVLNEQGYALHKNVPFEAATVNYRLPAPAPEKPWAPWDALLAKFHNRES